MDESERRYGAKRCFRCHRWTYDTEPLWPNAEIRLCAICSALHALDQKCREGWRQRLLSRFVKRFVNRIDRLRRLLDQQPGTGKTPALHHSGTPTGPRPDAPRRVDD